MTTPSCRVRCCVSISKGLRWVSHLEFLRSFTRALRRADLPVAYSQGFNPHARISFATARPVGMASEAEYVDVFFEEDLIGGRVKEDLGRVLPSGMAIPRCEVVDLNGASLASRVNASRYLFETEDLDREHLMSAVTDLQRATELRITRVRRNKPDRELDIRPGILSIGSPKRRGAGLAMEAELAMGGEGGVRPEELWRCLRAQLAGTDPEGFRPIVTRIDIHRREGDRLISPWCL